MVSHQFGVQLRASPDDVSEGGFEDALLEAHVLIEGEIESPGFGAEQVDRLSRRIADTCRFRALCHETPELVMLRENRRSRLAGETGSRG